MQIFLSLRPFLVALHIPVSRSPIHFKVEQLAPHAWVLIHNDHHGQAICNAGIVDPGDKTIVFDPFMTPEAARELKMTIKT